MSDEVKILYNGEDAFYPQPTPLIELNYESIYVGEKIGEREVFTLNGQITGCVFEDLVSNFNRISEKFKKNYQNLEIWQIENSVSGRVFDKELVEVNSITVPQSRWVGVLPYTISLNCYPRNYFSGTYGILEPSDSWYFNENENATLSIDHRLACLPFNTSSSANNALRNARNWAFSRTGLSNFVNPIFISGVSQQNFFLKSEEETVDRFNGAYSLTQTYSNDLARTGYGIIRYSTNINSGNGGINTITLNGSVEGVSSNIQLIRNAFNNIDKTAIAVKQYKDIFNMDDMNPTPLSQRFNENEAEGRLEFEYVFNNENVPDVSFDYTVSLNTNLNGFISATIEGDILVRGGTVYEKLERAEQYSNTLNLKNLIIPFYNNFDASSPLAPLNDFPTVSGKAINRSQGVVSLNATFDNKDRKSDIFEDFNFSISFKPTVTKVDSKPILNGYGQYSLVNLRYGERARIEIEGTALAKNGISESVAKNQIKQTCYQLFTKYGRPNAIIENNNVTSEKADGKSFSFSFAWSFDSPNRIGPSSISSLLV